MAMKDLYAEALARSKDGLPLSKEQKAAMEQEAEKHRKFRGMKRALDGLRKPPKQSENLK